MKVLVTGAAGFIGSHLSASLIADGHSVIAVDNFDGFYDPRIKRSNVERLVGSERFRLVHADICDLDGLQVALAGVDRIDVIVHLAARAGVRPSIEDPLLYTRVNVDGTVAMLELARLRGVSRFVFASSSSVYGNSAQVPFSEANPVAQPISPYAATKRAGELLCHTYHHLFGLSMVCLRFFTVYGPRQRPDLAIHKFARLMMNAEPLPMFGTGETARDYTYIDDIIQGVTAAIGYTGLHPHIYEIVNLGGSRTTTLKRLVELLSEAFGTEPRIRTLPSQPGDVERTFADVSRARELFGYEPKVAIEEGIPRFVKWLIEWSGANMDGTAAATDEPGSPWAATPGRRSVGAGTSAE